MRQIEVKPSRFVDVPENDTEADQTSRIKPLHSQVLAVARIRIEGAWCAYLLPVPGVTHSIEWKLWRELGDKLPKNIAEAIFHGHDFTELPYAH